MKEENESLRQGLWLALNVIHNCLYSEDSLSERQKQDALSIAQTIQGLLVDKLENSQLSDQKYRKHDLE